MYLYMNRQVTSWKLKIMVPNCCLLNFDYIYIINITFCIDFSVYKQLVQYACEQEHPRFCSCLAHSVIQ